MKKQISILLFLTAGAAGQVRFEERTLATDLKGGYQLIAVDLNKDGRKDLVALASGIHELLWFENPGWERHVVAGGFSRMINVAPLDADGDGIPELVLAHEFANVAKNSMGIVSLLESGGKPNEPWKVREIDRIPTSHRLRPIRLRDGEAVVNAALTASTAEPPLYQGKVPVVLYRPPAWKREPLMEAIGGVMHGIFPYDWNGDGHDELLTASFEGVHLFDPAQRGKPPKKLAEGDPADWPKSGASEITVGHLGKERFLATIEPWHGNQVCVYREKSGTWVRHVIDESETDGHTLHTADLDGDGRDEVIAGFRGPGRSVFYYQADGKDNWERHDIDKGGIAAAGCAVADFDADGHMDVACIGSATANLKVYHNAGR